MAAKKKTKTARRVEAQIGLDAISIEGALLSPSWLGRIAQQAAPGQTDSDYSVPKGLSLRDEIGRYWRIAQAYWAEFARGQAGGGDGSALARRLILGLLKECFGFSTVVAVDDFVVDERSYPIGHSALGGRVPIVIAAAGIGLDTPEPSFGEGGRRRTAFGLVQEYLNAEDLALWGIVTDGVTLRIVRDNASLTRPAWIEADLARIFNEERHPDFTALWLLIHESRFGRPDQPVTECPLEAWRNAGQEEGTRARDHLRDGVEEALLVLGRGFLSHPENRALRTALQDGILSTREYFNQLLRLVYRLIFLLTVEERGLLHADGDEKTKALYAEGYSLRRLRDRSVKRSAHDRFSDAWEGVKIVIRGVAQGEPRLALPALAGIFANKQCPDLDGAKLENHVLLLAMFRLSWLRDDGALARVNWRDMGPEELGSVYESLLELVPKITKDGREFGWAQLAETKGNARKTSGSYYTPDGLVQVLLDNALEPVIADTIARNPEQSIEALLSLSIVDPACGSGHFLLAAARRLAGHVARLQANGTPSPVEYRHALRQVVSRCIYGVDLNPMAVELCKVSLWMEAVEPGLPLTFLDSHVQRGNSLLGTTPELMAKGIPDAAWNPIEGDDKKTASALRKRNKKAVGGQRGLDTLWSRPAETEAQAIARAVAELDAATDANLDALDMKEGRWNEILDSPEYRHQKFVADAWCGAFVWPKQPGDLFDAAPTNEVWRQLRDGQGQAAALTRTAVAELVAQFQFFHWHLQFPQVFAKGGFDVVLGNPPWERVKLQEQEFFASRSEEIARAANAAARKKLIAKLQHENPQLWEEWTAASRTAEGESQILRQSGRYPLCGKGDVNTYAIFAEHNRSSLAPRGRAGFIVPTGLATDDTTKEFFVELVSTSELSYFYSFENEEFIFPGVHHAFKFALLGITRAGNETVADLVFFARHVAALADPERHFCLSPADFETLNPNTRTCPTFRSRRDAEINIAMYRHAGILWKEARDGGNPWNVRVKTRLWHMAEDAEWFRDKDALLAAQWYLDGNTFVRSGEAYVPLLEAKMVHHFDHRFGTYEGQSEAQENQGKLPEFDDAAHNLPHKTTWPYYWVPGDEVAARLRDTWGHGWLLGWRDICRSTDRRTVIASIFPQLAAGNTLPLMFVPAAPALCASFYAALCSYVFDYAARQKIGGTHLTFNYFKQLPFPAPTRFEAFAAWQKDTRIADWVLPRVLELTYTAWDLELFARDLGYSGTPFRWNAERRFQLRCELDAAFFHIYGLTSDEVDHVMESFPVVRKSDEKSHGDYRTKGVILEIFDALADAVRSGKPYRTPLDPLPASPGASHGTYSPDGTPRDYAEALRAGLLFTMIRRSGDTGVSASSLARALLWLRESTHAATWLEGPALADFERVREADPLLGDPSADSQAPKLLAALETEKVITQDAKGIVRLRAGGSIPNWLPQTPTLAKLASLMRDALERAEQGSAEATVSKTRPGKEKLG